MRRIALLATIAFVAAPVFAASQQPAPPAPHALTLEQIMANPDWIGHAVERPYWSADGRHIYYRLKRDGSEIRDVYRVDPATGKRVKLRASELAQSQGKPVFDAAHRHVAWVRHGDVFVREGTDGKVVQVTRTPERESGLQWSANGSAVQFRRGNQWFSYRLTGGTSVPVASVEAKDDPEDTHPDALGRLQLNLFKTLRHEKKEHDTMHAHEQALDKADATRSPRPFYLGKKVSIVDTSLAPTGRWLLVVTQPAHYEDGKQPTLLHYVDDSGYPKPEKARPYVGRNKPPPQSLWLLDLSRHAKYKLSLDDLPGIHTDPLKKLRKQTQTALRKAGHKGEAKALKAPKTRAVSVTGFLMHPMVWSDDGSKVAIELRANDNKDRWIATIDLSKHKLVTQNRLHDPAWISWNFNAFGFIPHSHTLWYASETSGYAQLYTKALGGKARKLTAGHFEVSGITPSADGKWFYLTANKQAPYAYDVYRVPVKGGKLERLTHFEAIDGFDLSPDGKHLAVLHSKAYMLPQLAVIGTDGHGEHELTDTMKRGFKAIGWIEPKIVKVPSTHGAGAIYAKVWVPKNFDAGKPHPGAFFVHGAGYLQDVTKGWTYYFREQMFNNLLAREGYVVIDLDYRASAGYGRDWRTAIYERMGHPELQDLLDGKAWLIKHYHVDPKRVGIYGGSYGGFMTEMALLRAPGEFAAGAALRPPSDWTSYNGPYTSDILNDPQIDPKAYKISSPIEYAKNLADPLLIEHGLVDNNVMPSDSIRLYQRFIELHKNNFWLSLYPMERHAFEHPDSWYDEYRRVHELFTRFVKNRGTTGYSSRP
jgi:dipeptidyl aminopeptidase/acylaminoacyl peptidase